MKAGRWIEVADVTVDSECPVLMRRRILPAHLTLSYTLRSLRIVDIIIMDRNILGKWTRSCWPGMTVNA